MSRILGYLLGLFFCFDGGLALLAPNRWAGMWRNVGDLLPEDAGDLVRDSVDLTQRYQERESTAVKTFFGTEIALGLLMLWMARKGEE